MRAASTRSCWASAASPPILLCAWHAISAILRSSGWDCKPNMISTLQKMHSAKGWNVKYAQWQQQFEQKLIALEASNNCFTATCYCIKARTPRFQNLGVSHNISYFAFKNSSQSKPNCRITARNVPIFKSFAPQSGRGAILSLSGLCQIRCDPDPPRGNSSQPSDFSFFEASRYFIQQGQFQPKAVRYLV